MNPPSHVIITANKMVATVRKFVCTAIIISVIAQGCLGYYKFASVYCEQQKCSIKMDVLDTEATAYGVYNDTLEETGWGILNITAGLGTKPGANDDIMYAAGYLEAILTQKRIYQHFLNLNDYFTTRIGNQSDMLFKVKDFLTTQDRYMRKMIKTNSVSDPYWRHMGYILAQYDGLVQGYAAIAPSDQQLDLYAFQELNGNGDLLDLITALSPRSATDWRSMTREELTAYVARNGHCSALIKVLGAYEDIFMSHSSWFIYQATMRIFKHYNLNVNDPDTAAKRLSFSSYPGYLESLDDFYLLGSGLVMLQTTNNVFNTSLFDQVSPYSLLAWHRVRLAHMMAHNGKEWGAIFSENNSGTYNNQYMILDLSKVHLGQRIDDGALWVVEQIPGLVEYGDTTDILRTGYWPSYNVPFWEKVYNYSGYPEVVAEKGLDFSYQLAPRAKIFRRDEGNVKDLMTMKKIMRYNDYKEDPYSEGDACNAICCRGDLRNKSPGPFGCYDTKVSNYQMAQAFTADIINGPSLGTGLPPFEWSEGNTPSHVGLPKMYDFNFIRTQPLKNL